MTLIVKFYTVDTYRATYNRPYVPVLIVNFFLSQLLPPQRFLGPGDDLLRDARKAALSRKRWIGNLARHVDSLGTIGELFGRLICDQVSREGDGEKFQRRRRARISIVIVYLSSQFLF